MNTLAKIALAKIKGIGPKLGRNLLSYCGSPEAIFGSSKKQLLKIPGIGLSAAEAILSKSYLQEAEAELHFIQQQNIQLVWMEDANYPRRLRHCEDAPILLFFKGNASLNPDRAVSIIGSRNASSYGRKICENLLADLKEINVQVISGLAFGIDIQAHREALKQELPTVAVLGHGLDRIYPYAHHDTAQKIIDHGGLLSEFTAGCKPERQNFPMRNRIIAGLSDVVVVVEAARKGGALITAEIANSYNRDVCAFPGAIDHPYSAGCNYLIKTNQAQLIRNAKDLCELMNWDFENTTTTRLPQLQLLLDTLSVEEQKIVSYLRTSGEGNIDDIAIHCQWTQSKLAITLLEMELKGILSVKPGKVFKLAT